LQIQDRLLAGAKHIWLVDRRKESVGVNRLAGLDGAARVGHDDVAGQRLALRSETVQYPRTHAGKSRNNATGEELVLSGRVYECVGLARADHGQIVGACSYVWQQIRNPQTALPVLLKGSLGAEELGVAFNELPFHFAEFFRPCLAVQLIQQRLRVKGFEVAWATGHEQEDDR